jgi:hypothetical protein
MFDTQVCYVWKFTEFLPIGSNLLIPEQLANC